MWSTQHYGIPADKDVRDEEEIKTQEELTTSKLAISVADVKGSDSEDAIDIADLKDNKEVIEEETTPYVAVEQMPQFPGGNEALLKYISTHLKYPVIAAENGIQGTVTLRFVVSPTGVVTKVEVLRQLVPSCDKEAIRVIKSLPQWVPGKQNGQPVPVYFLCRYDSDYNNMEVKCINGRLVWGIFMIVIYLGMSFLLIFTNLFSESMSFTMRIVFGILFFCYTLFRSYRLVKDSRQ